MDNAIKQQCFWLYEQLMIVFQKLSEFLCPCINVREGQIPPPPKQCVNYQHPQKPTNISQIQAIFNRLSVFPELHELIYKVNDILLMYKKLRPKPLQYLNYIKSHGCKILPKTKWSLSASSVSSGCDSSSTTISLVSTREVIIYVYTCQQYYLINSLSSQNINKFVP